MRIGRSGGAVARHDPRELGADPVLDCHCAQSRSADAADVSAAVRLTSPVATGSDTTLSVRPLNPSNIAIASRNEVSLPPPML